MHRLARTRYRSRRDEASPRSTNVCSDHHRRRVHGSPWAPSLQSRFPLSNDVDFQCRRLLLRLEPHALIDKRDGEQNYAERDEARDPVDRFQRGEIIEDVRYCGPPRCLSPRSLSSNRKHRQRGARWIFSQPLRMTGSPQIGRAKTIPGSQRNMLLAPVDPTCKGRSCPERRRSSSASS